MEDLPPLALDLPLARVDLPRVELVRFLLLALPRARVVFLAAIIFFFLVVVFFFGAAIANSVFLNLLEIGK